MEKFCHAIDTINERVGRVTSLLLLIILFAAVFEVGARYIFNRPTVWVWDVNVQLMSVVVFWAAGYTLLIKGHVRVDVLVRGRSLRTQAIIDLITSCFFFFIIGALLWESVKAAWHSVLAKEFIGTSILEPPLYPLKVMMTAGILLLLLQGIVKFIRDVATVTHSKRGSP